MYDSTMSDEQKYTIHGLDEYIRQGEPQQRERSEAWKVAIGHFVEQHRKYMDIFSNFHTLRAIIFSKTVIFL